MAYPGNYNQQPPFHQVAYPGSQNNGPQQNSQQTQFGFQAPYGQVSQQPYGQQTQLGAYHPTGQSYTPNQPGGYGAPPPFDQQLQQVAYNSTTQPSQGQAPYSGVYNGQPYIQPLQQYGQQPVQPQVQHSQQYGQQPAPYGQQGYAPGMYGQQSYNPVLGGNNQFYPQQPYQPQQGYTPSQQAAYNTSGYPQQSYPPTPANNGVVSEEQAQKDIIVLYNALSGLGTDELAIINLLTIRTPPQLQQIANAYHREAYGKSLWKAVDDDTSGDFERLLEALIFPLHQYEARCVHNAISGLGTHDKMLIEVLVTQTNTSLFYIKQMYMQLYKKDMMKDVQNDVSGDFGKVVYGMLLGARDEAGQFKDVAFDVEALYKAGPGKFGTDEKTIINILTNRSIQHLNQVFPAYLAKYGKPLTAHIKSEFSGKAETGLLSLIRYIQDPVLYVAEELEESMAGLGTNERKLIRLVAKFFHHYDPRNDLRAHIKQRYQQKYGKTLEKRISGEVSGDLKKLLMGIITRA